MKKVLLITLLTVPSFAFGQMTSLLTSIPNNYSIIDKYRFQTIYDNEQDSKFAIFLNPLGFVQFGPMIGAEIGLKENLALHMHGRFSSLGALSYVVRDGADKINGIGIGAGPIFFIGERQHKPYAGLIIEYDREKVLYSEGSSYEYTTTENNIVFMCNGGYRFNFSGGFFISTGGFFGAAKINWLEEYTDPSRGDPEEGTQIYPYGMLELKIGLRF